MTQRERYMLYLDGKPESEICENCRYFHPHFIAMQDEYQRVDAGHCGYPRVKLRYSYDTCQYFYNKNKGLTQ